MDKKYYGHLIDLALSEDLGELGDVSALALPDRQAEAYLMSKDIGILAGIQIFKDVFTTVDPNLSIHINYKDGDELKYGDIIVNITGSLRSILTAERTAINFLGYLSGIATKSNTFAKIAKKNGDTIILDTRKTLPGYRVISKYAVEIGGATKHRMGLYDMVMLKDNHIDLAGSIEKAVSQVRSKWGDKFRIEVETRDLDEVSQALAQHVDVIMLDNMDLPQIKEAINLRNQQDKNVSLEISGGVEMDTLEELTKVGVTYISSGALTHSVKSYDFSLKIKK